MSSELEDLQRKVNNLEAQIKPIQTDLKFFKEKEQKNSEQLVFIQNEVLALREKNVSFTAIVQALNNIEFALNSFLSKTASPQPGSAQQDMPKGSPQQGDQASESQMNYLAILGYKGPVLGRKAASKKIEELKGK